MEKEVSSAFLWKQRLGLGSIEFGRNLADFMNTSYLMVFLTDVARIDPKYISVMFLVSKLFDAFTDYIVSVLVDRTNTKIGRSRPWMFGGMAVLAISLLFLFHVPRTDNTVIQVVYAYATYIFFTLGMTMVVIPEGALIPALSADQRERTTLATSRGVAGGIANLVMSNLVVILLAKFGVISQATGYFRTIMIVAAAAALFVYLGLFLIREINIPEYTGSKNNGSQLKTLKVLFTDKNYIIVLIYGFGQLLGMIPLMSELVYYFQYIVGDMKFLPIGFSIFSIVPSIFSFLCPFVNRKLSKKNLARCGAAMDLLAMLTLLFVYSNPHLVIAALALWGAGNGFVGTMLWAIQPEVFDNLELKTGRAVAAVPTAIVSYACKIGNAAAGAITAALLSWGGYVGGAEVQSAMAQKGILLGFIGVPIFAYFIMFVAMSFYDLDKKYPEIRRQLEKKHAKEQRTA